MPLADKFRWNNLFLGTVLAGVFTEGSLNQLRSHGFQVLYFPYEALIAAFQSEEIDIAFDERTLDAVFKKTTEIVENAHPEKMDRIRAHLIAGNQNAIDSFFEALRCRLGRHVTRIIVVPLYGRVSEFATIEAVIQFLDAHKIYEGSGEFRKYEIRVEFSNGDKVDASIESKNKVKEFIEFVARQ